MAVTVQRASSATVSFTTPQEIIINEADDSIRSYLYDKDGNGITSTDVGGKRSVDVNVAQSALPSGAATSANQTSTNTKLDTLITQTDAVEASLATIDAGIPAGLGQTTMAASMPVVLPSDQIVEVRYGDTANLDAFGRLRVSTPESLFDSGFEYDLQPLIWNSSITGAATITHDSNRVSAKLSTTTASGDEVIYQTRQYFKYHPGKSQFILFSGNIGGAQTNSRKRVGQFDANNGVYFEVDGLTAYVVIRSRVSGSVVNTRIAQADWNLDKLDGTGASGVTLDITKQNLLFIDYQWLGSGRIRFGAILGGSVVYTHEENHSNISTTPYSRTGTLPLRAEVTNTGITSASTDAYLTCATIYSEGGYAPEGVVNSTNLGTTARTITAATRFPLISIRKAAANPFIPIQVISGSLFFPAADDGLVEFIINGTLTGATFATAVGKSEADSAATAVTGGHVIHSFYISSSANGLATIDLSKLFESLDATLGATIAGVSDILTLAVTNITGAGQGLASITFKELY